MSFIKIKCPNCAGSWDEHGTGFKPDLCHVEKIEPTVFGDLKCSRCGCEFSKHSYRKQQLFLIGVLDDES